MENKKDDYRYDGSLHGDYPDDGDYSLDSILKEFGSKSSETGDGQNGEIDEKVNELIRSAEEAAKASAPVLDDDEDLRYISEEESEEPDDEVEEPTKIIDFSAFRSAADEADSGSETDLSRLFDDDGEDADNESWFGADDGAGERFSGFDFSEDEDEDGDFDDPEPDAAEEIERLSAPMRFNSIRSVAVGALAAVIAVLTVMYENSSPLPFGIGYSSVLSTAAIMILGFIAMIAGSDVLIRGAENAIRGVGGAETLVLFSCLFTSADGFVMLVSRNFDRGLPFVLISVVSLFFAMRGRIACDVGVIESLKASKAAANPFAVISEDVTDPERDIIKKVRGRTDGFYRKLTSADNGEHFISILTPVLLIVSFLFALIASVGRGNSAAFAHTFGIMTAVCAAFPMTMTFALPFKYVSSDLRSSGAALAGWGGTCDIADADGAVITDEDIFPSGSVALTGVSFFEGVNGQKALIDSCSLIISSQCGISRLFSGLLNSQGFAAKSVESFTFYEGGGIGGDVDGDHILCGTGAFMNLMGIRVPEKVNLANTVFASVNGELAAFYSVEYTPVNSVQTSLSALLSTKVNILLAVKDFNVTPNIISQKFRVNMDGVEYLAAEKSYRAAESENEAPDGVAAILAREGLGPFGEVIHKGKTLKSVADLNTLITLGGTFIGLLLQFFLCASGQFSNATCVRTFAVMIIIEICVFLLSQAVRRRA